MQEAYRPRHIKYPPAWPGQGIAPAGPGWGTPPAWPGQGTPPAGPGWGTPPAGVDWQTKWNCNLPSRTTYAVGKNISQWELLSYVAW